MFKFSRLICIAAAVVLLNACAVQQTGSRSSVVSYLYPDSQPPQTAEAIPHLTLPLRMGIAFVPLNSTSNKSHSLSWVGLESTVLTENQKMMLLQNVASHFKQQSFVEHIEIIPSAYLSKGGSFTNLDQLKTMFNIDVIALVSFDQVQFTSDSNLSLSYWTLVGAYLVSGQKNDTQTLMDTAVYDISSRKLLFRAPGTSQQKGRSTPVNLQQELRQDSLQGFIHANDDMITNLETKLDEFKQQLKKKPDAVHISYAKGYSGGATNLIFPLLALLLFRFKRGEQKK